MLELAGDNPGSGYTRIRDALRGLKIEIGRTTVATERATLLDRGGAACAVFHIARRKVVGGDRALGNMTSSLAARFELGFGAGRGIPSFAHIEPDVEGRNYLWSQLALGQDTMTRCETLDEAASHAILFMRGMREVGHCLRRGLVEVRRDPLEGSRVP